MANARLSRDYMGGEVLKSLSISFVMLTLSAVAGHADFNSWSVEKDSDPFSGGDSVNVSFMSSIRSGIIIQCETSQPGLTVRAIPGFDYDAQLDGFTPTLKFAIDGKVLFEAEGETGKAGNNLAFSQAQLTSQQATQFVDAFTAAKKQVAIDDGIANKPYLLSARGSKASGTVISACVKKQASP